MFVDTSGLISYHNHLEASHADAVRHLNAANIKLTHSYVLAEFVPLSTTRGLSRPAAIDFISELQDDAAVDIVYVDEALHRDAVDFLHHRLDKQWSLCDAVSFLLMQMRGETEALTTDHHFEQAGFVRLLKP